MHFAHSLHCFRLIKSSPLILQVVETVTLQNRYKTVLGENSEHAGKAIAIALFAL